MQRRHQSFRLRASRELRRSTSVFQVTCPERLVSLQNRVPSIANGGEILRSVGVRENVVQGRIAGLCVVR